MRKILAALALLWGAAAQACPIGAYPFILQNGTLADASQVMGNFNQVVAGVAANCAQSGINNDITALNALSTPITPFQGGSSFFPGGVVGGTSTAVTLTVATNFTLTPGYRVGGIVLTTNPAGSPVTLAVNSTGAQPFFRKTQLGPFPLNGGELIGGNPFIAVWNGSQWILEGEVQLVGDMKDFIQGFVPPGYLIADGSTFVCTSYPALCNLIANSWGGTPSNPQLPDTRGRVMVGLDNYGTSTGAANRLTGASTGCGTTINFVSAFCTNGSQSHTQIVAEIANHNHTLHDPGHFHNFQTGNGVGTNFVPNPSTNTASGSVNTGSSFTGVSIDATGSGQAMPIVNPNLGVLKIIKF